MLDCSMAKTICLIESPAIQYVACSVFMSFEFLVCSNKPLPHNSSHLLNSHDRQMS